MQHRDILQEQFDLFFRALGKIFSKHSDWIVEGKPHQAFEMTNGELVEYLNLDINSLVMLSDNELRTYLSTLPIHEKSLDLLADYLYQVGLHHKIDTDQDYLAYFKCANAVLTLADKKSNTITFDRMTLRAKIGSELRED